MTRPSPTGRRVFVVVATSRIRLWAPVVALALVALAVVVAAPSRPLEAHRQPPAVASE